MSRRALHGSAEASPLHNEGEKTEIEGEASAEPLGLRLGRSLAHHVQRYRLGMKGEASAEPLPEAGGEASAEPLQGGSAAPSPSSGRAAGYPLLCHPKLDRV